MIDYDHRNKSIEAAQASRMNHIGVGGIGHLSRKHREKAVAATHYSGEKPLWYLKCFFKALAIRTIIWIRMRFNV
jgi:hypothetical protein